jgi:hypothetical protein
MNQAQLFESSKSEARAGYSPASVISKHMALLEELGMIKVMHRYGMTPGQDVVRLLEV